MVSGHSDTALSKLRSNSMEHSPSEADSHSATQEIPCRLSMEPGDSLTCLQQPGNRMSSVTFRNKLFFLYGEEFLSPCPTPKVKDHPLSPVRDCLFSIFAAVLHIMRPPSLSLTRGRAMSWSQEPT